MIIVGVSYSSNAHHFEENEEGPLFRKKMHKILADARTILVLIQEENDPHKTYTFNQSLS